MGFYFDGSGQRTHRYGSDDLDREDMEPRRPSPGKSSRTHGGGDVLGKGDQALKIAIPFEGTEKMFISYLKRINKFGSLF